MKELTWQGIKLSYLEGMVKVLTFGAEKYAENNWMLVPNLRNRYFSALMRHLTSWAKGGDTIDEESGLNHLHHCLCNAYFLMYNAKYGVPKDVQVVTSKTKESDTIKLDKELMNKSSSKTNGVKFDDAKPKWHLVSLSLVREALELKRKDDIDGDIERHYEDLVQLCSYYSKERNDLSWSYVLFGRVLQLIIDVESNQ